MATISYFITLVRQNILTTRFLTRETSGFNIDPGIYAVEQACLTLPFARLDIFRQGVVIQPGTIDFPVDAGSEASRESTIYRASRQSLVRRRIIFSQEKADS